MPSASTDNPESEHLRHKTEDTFSYFPLFQHMSDSYGLTLLESEMDDICYAVEKMRSHKRNESDHAK